MKKESKASSAPPESVIPNTGGMTLAEHRERSTFPKGHRYAGMRKSDAVHEHFEWFLGEAVRVAIDMEQGIWLDPDTGQPPNYGVGNHSKTRIATLLGFADSKDFPSFLKEPHWSRSCEWERIKREAHTRMSAQTVKPLVSVAASAMLMELLNRALNRPEAIKDRELITETRKYIEMLVAWDSGTKEKPHIQTTLNILIANLDKMPAASRGKVRRMLGVEFERMQSAVRQLAAVAGEEKTA